ncbi:helix-turn-helix domain-containing protein [Morganella psychrotolerans]|uniref:helix-turn-helix domain-containing protein n=1 Tax=Morganella psychrotolerans TaxID=368603 RepID=UPI0039AFD86B
MNSEVYHYYMIGNLISWIEDNLENELSAEIISNKSGYSINYLQRKFKRITGYSISGYVRRRRIFRATLYLCLTGKSIAAISKCLGYRSSSVFIHLFKKNFLTTPLVYRRNKVLDLFNALPRIELMKERPNIEINRHIEHEEITLYGKTYTYTIAVTDFDKPHYPIRKVFREIFFTETGFNPDHYCTTAHYSPSFDDQHIDVSYFIGTDDITMMNSCPDYCKYITIKFKNAKSFKCTDNIINPYDVIIDVLFRILTQYNEGWTTEWDFERFGLIDNNRVTLEYIIPVQYINKQVKNEH